MEMYQLHTDDMLLNLLKEDDESAFNEIYNRYWRILFTIATSRLKNNHAAEDIIHDVFASLWKNRHSVHVRSLQHYLSSSTRYLIFKVIRKSVNEQIYIQAGSLTNNAFELENALHNKKLLEFVANEIETLPERCKMIFKYSREHGMTNKEIALEMNITSKTVENQINKALNHLRFSMKRILFFFF